MTIRPKINDLDYCYAVWQILIHLEKNTFARNERIRSFQKQIQKRESLIINFFAFMPIIFLWFKLFHLNIIIPNQSHSIINIGTRILGLLMVSVFLYLFIYLILKLLSQHNPLLLIKLKFETNLRTQFISDIKQIDSSSSTLISDLNTEKLRLPENLMSAELIEMLIRYFENGQALTIQEAIYDLRLELKNTGYYSNLLPQETLLAKVNNYLTQQELFFETVEKGEL